MTERYLGKNALGTTKRGIGPAYADKATRVGPAGPGPARPQDLPPEARRGAEGEERASWPRCTTGSRCRPTTSAPSTWASSPPGSRRWWPTPSAWSTTPSTAGRHVLLEGAQATFLDLDHGTYPVRHLLQPGGRRRLHRLGHRPPLHRRGHRHRQGLRDPGRAAGRSPPSWTTTSGDLLVDRGHEYGANTGRRRRCGWFDAVMMRQAVRLNSLSEVALTKLDVLDTFDTVKVCVAYEADGERFTHPPYHQSVFHQVDARLRGAARVETDLDLGHRARRPAPGGPRLRALPGRADRRAGPPRRGGPGPRAVRPLRRMSREAPVPDP